MIKPKQRPVQYHLSFFSLGVTGNVSIDANGDRSADYTLLDMDKDTGILQVTIMPGENDQLEAQSIVSLLPAGCYIFREQQHVRHFQGQENTLAKEGRKPWRAEGQAGVRVRRRTLQR